MLTAPFLVSQLTLLDNLPDVVYLLPRISSTGGCCPDSIVDHRLGHPAGMNSHRQAEESDGRGPFRREGHRYEAPVYSDD